MIIFFFLPLAAVIFFVMVDLGVQIGMMVLDVLNNA